ncbi:MAG: anthranilate synthase component I [Thermoanaerobacteraceae bacterium]|nr:anthranilate synthase component I [Thermoanaerobacteraceae bacterium]
MSVEKAGYQGPGNGVKNSVVKVGNVLFGGKEFQIMAGPCAVESEQQLLATAAAVAQAGASVLRGGAYKPRSSPHSFQGLGEHGLDLLLRAKEVSGLPVVTEVVSTVHVEQVAAYADLLQVGARNMQNFELLRRLGELNKPVLLKRGLSATVEEWLYAAEYLLVEGNHQIILCERGIRTYESATRFTLDLSAVPLAKSRTELPVVVDPSHGTGRADLVLPMAKAAVAAGADGLLIEVHPSPDNALCDGKQSLTIQEFKHLVEELRPFVDAAGRQMPSKRDKYKPAIGTVQFLEGVKVIPDYRQYCQKVTRGDKVIPVYTEVMIGNETPASALLKLGQTPYSFILESVEGNDQIARYSFVGNDPYLVFQAAGSKVKLGKPGEQDAFPNKICQWEERDNDQPLAELRKLLQQYTAETGRNLPRFFGGAVGYIGFEGVRYFEPVLAKTLEPGGLADINMIFTRSLLIFDHLKSTLKVVVNTLPGDNPEKEYHRAQLLIRSILGRMKKNVQLPAVSPGGNPAELKITSNFTKEQFCNAVQKAKEYIDCGDAFQIVLSQRFSLPADFAPLALLRCLKAINPSPYMFYLQLEDLCLVGASPEMLVRLENGQAQLRPIAGTRKRGRDREEDLLLTEDLRSDEKEQAEHVMLVDLGRNDLGRVCRFGTVTVEEFSQVEYFSHVMHLVSCVTGRVLPGKDALDVLAAAFPAGTVSGAPKIRAIEIIRELEKTPRGPYAGMVGYLAYSGQMDICINIRSVTVHQGRAYVQTGAGIVADSKPEKEYQETLNKAQAMFQAIAMARGEKQ